MSGGKFGNSKFENAETLERWTAPGLPTNEDVENYAKSIKESDPAYCTGKKWYTRDEVIRDLMRMNYSEQIAQELADWHLRNCVLAFNRGLFNGVKKTMQGDFGKRLIAAQTTGKGDT